MFDVSEGFDIDVGCKENGQFNDLGEEMDT